MDHERESAIRECVALSLAARIAFPDVVRRLSGAGVERYHADLSREEETFYLPGGDSLVESMGRLPEPIGETFDAAAVEAAIRRSQRGEIRYPEFLRQIMAAGCVGYFVQITGRRALYFGREGDAHVEPFPPTSDRP